MKVSPRRWRGLAIRFLGGGLALALPLTSPAWAQDGTTDAAAAPTAAVAVMPAQGLAEFLQLALERQPAIAARRASLASAESNQRGLDDIRVPAFIVRELPIRRKQARIGVSVAAAAVDEAEHDTIYAVTRTYYSVLYAREQQKVADEVVTNLRFHWDAAKQALKSGAARDLTRTSVDKAEIYLHLAETRQGEAVRGIARALAALKEAVGLDPCCRIEVVGDRLPEPQVTTTREEILALALARRPELAQAALLAEITCLEADAQGTTCRSSFHTFAAVADIHSKQIPQGSSDGDYRPGAIGPEMPTTLVGPRRDRVERARDLNSRAGSVAEKTRNLIALEAEDAYLRWEETSRRVPQTRDAARVGVRLAETTRQDYAGMASVKLDELITNEVLAATARGQRNEALYQEILALAALERVTAGGFNAGLAGPLPPRSEPTTTTNGQTDSSNGGR